MLGNGLGSMCIIHMWWNQGTRQRSLDGTEIRNRSSKNSARAISGLQLEGSRLLGLGSWTRNKGKGSSSRQVIRKENVLILQNITISGAHYFCFKALWTTWLVDSICFSTKQRCWVLAFVCLFVFAVINKCTLGNERSTSEKSPVSEGPVHA